LNLKQLGGVKKITKERKLNKENKATMEILITVLSLETKTLILVPKKTNKEEYNVFSPKHI
jgi:hypothetical protein